MDLLFVAFGFLLGSILTRRRVTHHTSLVFPRATDPVVIEVDNARIKRDGPGRG